MFIRLIDANVVELLALRIEFAASGAPPELRWYLEVIYAYLEGNTAALRELAKSIPEGHPALQRMLELRTAIRNGRPHELALAELAAEAELWPEEWRAEIQFSLGMAYSYTSDTIRSRTHYLRAVAALETLGARRKASVALLNFVVAESKLYPEKRLIPDYRFVSERALAAGAPGIAAVAQMNISQEYEIMGAYESALGDCERALALAETDRGSAHYYFIVLQRAHLLYLLDRPEAARMAAQEALGARIPEVECALRAFAVLTGKQTDRVGARWEAGLTPPWQDKLERYRASCRAPTKARLTPSENQLLELLGTGPKSKAELIFGLYGARIGTESAENRLRVLISRLRKKSPGLVDFTADRYVLASDSVLGSRRNAG